MAATLGARAHGCLGALALVWWPWFSWSAFTAAAPQVVGQVVDERGVALAGVHLVLVESTWTPPEKSPPAWPRAVSDREGRFVLVAPRSGSHRLLALSAERPPAVLPVEVKGPTTRLPPFRLDAGAALSGRVVGDDGKALLGAVVELPAWPQLPGDLPFEVMSRPFGDATLYRAVTTAGDGRFRIVGVDPRAQLFLRVSAAGHVPLAVAQPSGAADVGELRLVRAGSVRVQVVDVAGKPIAGARVGVSGSDGAEVAGHVVEVPVTDAAGRCELPPLAPGEWRVSVYADGYLPPEPVWVRVVAGELALVRRELVAPPTAPLAVLVLAHDDRPVAGATLTVATRGGEPHFHRKVETDVAGRVRLERVPLASYAITATHPRFLPVRHELVLPAAGEEVTLAFAPPLWDLASVAGRVETADGTGIGRVFVSLQRRRGPPYFSRNTMTAADGGFHLDDVPTGEYGLWWSGTGIVSPSGEPPRLLVPAHGVDDLVVRVSRGATVRGLVHGLAADPRLRLEVKARQVSRGTGRQQYAGEVGAQGSFSITGLPAGATLVEAAQGTRLAQARVEIAADAEVGDLRLELPAGFRVTGSARWRGTPLAGASVILTLGGDPGRVAVAIVDAGGEFVAEGVGPGPYRLELAAPGSGPLLEEDLRLDGDRRLELDVRAARLAGHVVALDGPLPTHVDLRLQILDRGYRSHTYPEFLRLDSAGRFTTPPLQAARWKVHARAEGYLPAETIVDLRSGEDVGDVRLELRPQPAAP